MRIVTSDHQQRFVGLLVPPKYIAAVTDAIAQDYASFDAKNKTEAEDKLTDAEVVNACVHEHRMSLMRELKPENHHMIPRIVETYRTILCTDPVKTAKLVSDERRRRQATALENMQRGELLKKPLEKTPLSVRCSATAVVAKIHQHMGEDLHKEYLLGLDGSHCAMCTFLNARTHAHSSQHLSNSTFDMQ